MRRLCGSPYGEHCEKLVYAGEGQEIGGKKLDNYCLYCTEGKRVKKIKAMASWTGLTPKWCPKLKKERSNESN